jgi:hypothetical protein
VRVHNEVTRTPQTSVLVALKATICFADYRPLSKPPTPRFLGESWGVVHLCSQRLPTAYGFSLGFSFFHNPHYDIFWAACGYMSPVWPSRYSTLLPLALCLDSILEEGRREGPDQLLAQMAFLLTRLNQDTGLLSSHCPTQGGLSLGLSSSRFPQPFPSLFQALLNASQISPIWVCHLCSAKT